VSAFEIFGKIGGGEPQLSVIDSHVRVSLCVSNGSIYGWVTISKMDLKCQHGGTIRRLETNGRAIGRSGCTSRSITPLRTFVPALLGDVIRRRFGRRLCEREGKCEREPSRNGGAEPSQRITQFRSLNCLNA